MKLALVIGGLLAAVGAVYLLAAWAQRRGWVNFRAAGSGMTAGVAEVCRVLDPPTKHAATVQEETPARSERDEPPSTSSPSR
jgi:hypothetical protein